jgi:RNA polymerase sigma-70 factor (ECF subfamily)
MMPLHTVPSQRTFREETAPKIPRERRHFEPSHTHSHVQQHFMNPSTATKLQQEPERKTPTSHSAASLQSMTDEELFTEVRENNSEAAFNVLYKRYDKRLFAYCLRATASQDAAKDAFQAVISTVFEKREQFTGGSYAAWLFTIARHHVMKVSKRQQRDLVQNKEIDDEFDALTPSDDGENSHERDFLLQASLERAINQLPDDLREAFELKFYDGLQHEEIADTLKISLSLAKVRVFRAKQQLRELLTPIFKELQ